MKIDFDSMSEIGFDCEIETENEVTLVREREMNRDEIKGLGDEDIADLEAQLCVGGHWVYNFNDLHKFVTAGVTLHGLPEWLIIK